jgi:hypothetical protein
MSFRTRLSAVSARLPRACSCVNYELIVAGLSEEMDCRKQTRAWLRSRRSWLGTCMDCGHTTKWSVKSKFSSPVMYGDTACVT